MKNRSFPTVPLRQNWGALKIAGIYLLTGWLWILFSDRFVTGIVMDRATLMTISIYKGWGYVLVTAFLLYWLIRRHTDTLRRDEEQLQLVVTQQRQTEDELRQWADAFEGCAHGIALIDPDTFRITACNPAFAGMHKCRVEDVIGVAVLSLYPSADHEMVRRNFEKADQIGLTRFEAQMIRKDASTFPVQMDVVSVRGENGVILYRVATAQDISERKHAEEELREREKQLTLAISSARMSMWEWDPQTNEIAPALEIIEAVGREQDELQQGTESDTFVGLLHADDAARVLESAKEALARQSMFAEEFRILRPDGGVRWISSLSHPEYDLDRNIYRFLGTVQDITERKQAEEALRAGEEKYRLLFESNPLPMWIYDLETLRFLKVNDAAVRHYGYSADEFTTMTIKDIRPLEDVPKLLENVARVTAGIDEAGTWRHRKKDGTLIQVEIISHTVEFEGRRSELVLANDVTERKQTEEALREAEAKYRNLVERLPVIVYTAEVGINGRWTYVSPQIESLLGFTPDEWMADPGLWYRQMHPEDRERQDSVEQQAVVHGGSFDSEYRVFRKDGREIWIRDVGHVLPDQNEGAPIVQGTLMDVTERRKAEEALHRSEERYRALFEDMPVAIWEEDFSEVKTCLDSLKEQGISDLRGYFASHPDAVIECFNKIKVLDVNNAAVQMFHAKNKEELIQYTEHGLSKGEADHMIEFLTIIAGHGTSQYWEGADTTLSGDPIEISLNWSVVPGHEADYSRIIVTTIDVTESKRAEEALLKSEERYRALFEDSPVSIWEEDFSEVKKYLDALKRRGVTDLRAYFESHPEALEECAALIRILDVNKAALQLLKAESKEQLIEHTTQVLIKEELSQNLEDFIAIAEGRTSRGWEGTDRMLTGETIEISLQWSVAPGHEEDFSRVIVTVMDITERKRAEQELRDSEERFRQLANNIQEMFWITDSVNNKGIYVSPAAERIWGRPIENLMGDINVYLESILDEDRNLVISALERQRNGERTEMEFRITRPDGSVRWIWDRAFPIFDDSGRVTRVAGIAADITERKELELERTLLTSAISASLNEIYLFEADTLKFIFVNDGALRNLGYIQTEILRMTPLDLKPEFDPKSFQELLSPLLLRKKPMQVFETTHRRKDGSLYPVEVHLQLFERGERRVFLAVIQDITERKQADEKLRESEERFRSLFDHMQDGVYRSTHAGRFVEINPAMVKMFGYSSREEMLEVDIKHELYFDPSERGSHVLDTGKEEVEVYRMRRKDGSEIWVEDRGSYVHDEHGNIIYHEGILRDVTQRVQAERETARHLTELEALYENGLAIGRLLEPREIGKRIIETFTRYLSWHHVAIRLRKEDGDELELVAFNFPGLKEEQKEDVERLFNAKVRTVEHGMSGLAIRTGEPIRTGNVHEHPQYVDTHEGIQSGLYMPLKVGKRIIGVISVESEKPNAFTEQDERLLATLANQAAIAFENARLYQNVQRELAERKRVERELRESQQHYQDLFENSPIGTWLEDFSEVHSWMENLRGQGVKNLGKYLSENPGELKRAVGLIRILNVNHAAVTLNGARSKEELLERIHELMLEETPQQVMAHEMEMIWNGFSSFGFEMSSRKLDGSIITGIQRIFIPAKDGNPDFERVIVTSTDITDRVNMEQALRDSETHYRELADSITDVFFELDQNLRFTHWNKASVELTGVEAKDAVGKTIYEIFGASEEQTRIGKIYEDVLGSQQAKTFETLIAVNNEQRSFEITAYPSTRGVSVVAKDITARKRSETIMQKRFELMEFAAHHSLEEIMQKAMDDVGELTDSLIGFFHFMDADQSTPGLQTWSSNALRLFNVPVSEGRHLPVDQAGVWADAIRQRRPVIHNDYESLPNRKNLPEGHARIVREMVIPIIRNEKILAVMGIGNKPQEYTRQDIEIAERFADFAWDITERKQMEMALAEERNMLAKHVEERTSELSRANANLARALRVKDEFLANMSHELRTPLNAILGLSESLAEQIAGPLNEKQLKYISTIGESGHHLLALINDILDLAKIEAGQITLDINKMDVEAVCQASLRMINQLARKKNLEVYLDIEEGMGLMWADERRLKQMIVNLLSNAVKFTPEGGRIGLEVHGNQDENKVTITVWDTGIGIREGDLPRLFQPFVQLDSGLAREATGTGLGLALVAQMARLHGGSVTVESQPGKGSRFTIMLPWEPALAVDTIERMKITGKFRAVKPGEHKPTILLIEDTQEVIMMLRDYLEMNGYTIVTAQDGIEGVAEAKRTRPDLILMDIQMPRMNGFEATQKLRSDPYFERTPIIALTALAMPNDRERCLAAGMDEYISKPVNLKALVKIIQDCLSITEEPKTS